MAEGDQANPLTAPPGVEQEKSVVNEWLTAESFELTHSVISAINRLAIHNKLALANTQDAARSEPLYRFVKGGMSTGRPIRMKKRANACARCSRYGGRSRMRSGHAAARLRMNDSGRL